MGAGRFITLLLNIFIFSSLQGQSFLAPEMLSVEDGLSSGYVNTLLIDKTGFLWAGTNNGLNRYNGYQFNQFFSPSSLNSYPGIHVILKIRSDNSGNLWILNKGGINSMNQKSGEIRRYPVADFDEAFNREAMLIDAFITEDGTAWILSDRSLTAISPDQSIQTYEIPASLAEDKLPSCLSADLNNNIWIGTSGGLILFSIQEKKFKGIVDENSQGLLSNNAVQCLFFDGENGLWVGTQNGLNRMDPVDFSFYQFYPASTRSAQALNNIRDIKRSGSDQLLLGTENGLAVLHEKDKTFMNIFNAAVGQKLNAVALDSFGNILAATDHGILKIRRAKVNVRNYTTASSSLKLAHDDVSALKLYDSENKLFVGYHTDGYSVADLKISKIDHFSSINGSKIVGFYPFKPEEYFVVSEHDIEVYSTGGRQASLFSLYPFMKTDLVKDIRIKCLFYDGESGLWLGTSNGLQCIRIDSSKHYIKTDLIYQDQQIKIGQVYDIQGDGSGNLWLGTENGLIFYNPAKGIYNRYTPYDINMLNTEHKAVFSIVAEKSEIFWIGTSGGAFRFDLRSREFKALTNRPEIMNVSIKALEVDNKGNIWLGTESGLYYYNRSSNTIKSFDSREGLLNDSYAAISAGKNNNVYLGGPLGLSVIDLSTFHENSKTPNVTITGIRYIKSGMENQELYYHISDTITIPWHSRSVMLEFAVLDLSRPELNEYRYSFGKTKHDNGWHNLGNQPYIILDALSPGKYILKVMGSGSDMNWNSQGATLIINVEAPYWRSRIVMSAIILVSVLLIFLFIRFWIRQFFNLSRENQQREMFAKQIMLQKEELTLKNKAITDSINYAKRIQTAMLPPYKLFKSIFPSSFILFMPKDIVSGDFYWVNKVGQRIFIAAVDCTGHGVPGAFMSIIGFELFRKITNIEGLTRPSDILNRLNDDFHEIFKDVDNVVLRDGMDVAFCSIDKKDMILEFAGAFNPLYLIRDNKIMEVKGDRFAIGLDETNFREQTFKNHIIPIQKSDIVYVFSDGFADQFGGPDGKKYKYRRFRHLLLNLHQLPMEKQHEILENNVMEWRGEQDQVDDILVIGIKIDF